MDRPRRVFAPLAAKFCLVGLTLLIAACQREVKVEGTLDDVERVTATATGVPGKAGEIVLTGKDLHCTGTWQYIQSAGGLGLLQCSGGQSGVFFFNVQGIGAGALGNRKLLFNFTPVWKG